METGSRKRVIPKQTEYSQTLLPILHRQCPCIAVRPSQRTRYPRVAGNILIADLLGIYGPKANVGIKIAG